MRDREAFRQTRAEYKNKGERDVLSTGIVLDEVLIRELRETGSDIRHGVNLICLPNQAIVDQITALQRRLFQYEPTQYYYPGRDLHLTLVEVCHSRTEVEAQHLASAVQSIVPSFLERQQQPPAVLDDPMLIHDSRGAALNFLPRDEQLQHLRQALRDELSLNGTTIASRYPPTSAHITLLRYVTPLTTPAEKWVEILRDAKSTILAAWPLQSVWLTWGATWYGMGSRMSRYGPMRISGNITPR